MHQIFILASVEVLELKCNKYPFFVVLHSNNVQINVESIFVLSLLKRRGGR